MKLGLYASPRIFSVKGCEIRDMGKVRLEPGEMVSLVAEDGRECDVTRTAWGFYLGPSLNSRLRNQGFKVALVVNETNQLYVMAVEADKIQAFTRYLKDGQNSRLLCWLDEWLREEP